MFEQLSEILFYIKGGLRYKWMGLLLAWSICLIGWSYVFTIPNKYESSATVHIDTHSMLQPLLQGMAIQGNTLSMIRIIRQLIFSRDNLEEIIKSAHVKDALENRNIGFSQLLKKLKKSIVIAGNKENVFVISCETESSKLSRDIVDAVLTTFSEQSQQSSLTDVDLAQHFINTQIEDYEVRLKSAEKVREDFKRDNLEILASGEGGQLGSLQGVKARLEEALLILEQAESRYAIVNEQMEDVLESSQDWELDSSFVDAGEIKIESDITVLKDERLSLLLKYTEKHPAVKAIDSLIFALEQRELETVEDENIYEESDLPSAEDLTNPYVMSLQVSLNEAEANVAVAESTVFMLQQRIGHIEKDINSRLLIETKIANLNRDYEVIRDNYSELLQRRELAHISEKVDNETASLRFKIIESATKSIFPAAPNRKMLNSIILGSGLALGTVLALLLGLFTPTFMSIKQLRTALELPVLGGISLLKDEEKDRKDKRKFILYILLFLFLFFAYTVVMVIAMLQSDDVNAVTQMVGKFI